MLNFQNNKIFVFFFVCYYKSNKFYLSGLKIQFLYSKLESFKLKTYNID